MPLNSDDQQFHQYEQSEQSSRSHLNSLNIKSPRHMTLEIQVLAWDRYTIVILLNPLMVRFKRNQMSTYKINE